MYCDKTRKASSHPGPFEGFITERRENSLSELRKRQVKAASNATDEILLLSRLTHPRPAAF